VTLIAALNISGVPVLIGDFMLTDNAVGQRHIFSPTSPHLVNQRAVSGGRRVCGLRKKIHCIGDKLAVGFTGSLNPGVELMKRLHNRFKQAKPKIPELKQFLSSESFPGKKETELCGWICENRPLCFRWYGSRPDEFLLVDSAISGSGGAHFRAEVMPAGAGVASSGMRTAVDDAIYGGVCKAGRILAQELRDGRNVELGYGSGAEMIFWDGARFRYVSDVSYGFWNMLVNPDNTLQVMPSNVAAVYKNCGEYYVFQTIHLAPTGDANGGLEATNTYVQMITPMYDKMKSFDVRSIGRLSLDKDLWFSGIVVLNPAKRISLSVYMVSQCSDDPDAFVHHRDGQLSLAIGQLVDILPPEIWN
jgi:hypothetical protein